MRESMLIAELITRLWPTVQLRRTNAGTFRSLDGKHIVKGLPKGFPDLFGVIPKQMTADGRPMPVFIEAKVHPNKPTPEQLKYLAEYRLAGCCAGVCYSVEDAFRLIEPYIKR